MAEISIRTKRPIYTESDRQVLLDLVKEFESVIGNKCLNSITRRQKEDAWDSVTELYNSYQTVVNGTLRTASSLHNCYKNHKHENRIISNQKELDHRETQSCSVLPRLLPKSLMTPVSSHHTSENDSNECDSPRVYKLNNIQKDIKDIDTIWQCVEVVKASEDMSEAGDSSQHLDTGEASDCHNERSPSTQHTNTPKPVLYVPRGSVYRRGMLGGNRKRSLDSEVKRVQSKRQCSDQSAVEASDPVLGEDESPPSCELDNRLNVGKVDMYIRTILMNKDVELRTLEIESKKLNIAAQKLRLKKKQELHELDVAAKKQELDQRVVAGKQEFDQRERLDRVELQLKQGERALQRLAIQAKLAELNSIKKN